MILSKEMAAKLNIYTYTFLDDLLFIKSPYDFFYGAPELVADAINIIQDKFVEQGWEGDGSVGIIWLPPFVDVGIEDTHGNYIWHVKQNNNGVSFLACDFPLSFKRIDELNERQGAIDLKKKGKPVGIIYTCVEWFVKLVEEVENEHKSAIAYLLEHKKRAFPTA